MVMLKKYFNFGYVEYLVIAIAPGSLSQSIDQI